MGGRRPGTDKGARKRALRLRAARRPPPRVARARCCGGGGSRGAPGRRSAPARAEGGMWGVPAPHTKAAVGREAHAQGGGRRTHVVLGEVNTEERCLWGSS